VHAALVVDAVRLGPLDDVAEPARRPDVRVLQERGEDAVEAASATADGARPSTSE
jgi:hypothetical protein